MNDGNAPLFHLCLRLQWEAFRGRHASRGGVLDDTDGFLHLSTGRQLVDTAALHFPDIHDLVALTIDARALPTGQLKWETSRGGALFPHLYGSLSVDAVLEVTPLPDDPDHRARILKTLIQFARR